MADKSYKLAIIVTAQDLAAGKLSKVKSELAGLGPGGKIAAIGMGTLAGSSGKLGGALSTLKGRIASVITGPLGLIGLGASIGGVIAGIKTAIGKAQDFGTTSADLSKLIGLPIEPTSRLVDTLDKFGVSGTDQLATLGKLEKGADSLAKAQLKADAAVQSSQQKLAHAKTLKERAAAQKDLTKAQDAATKANQAQGFALLDSNGKIADANELLKRSADFFNSSATQSQKATVLSKLYGRSWQTLIPILALGRKGIEREEAAALHLTTAQQKQLAQLRNDERELNDTIGDTQVLVGLQAVPALDRLVKAANTWLSDARNQQAIHDAFDRGISLAEDLAGVLTGQVIPAVEGIAGAAGRMWGSIPGPLKDLLVKGFIADKTVKFLFGFDPLAITGKALFGGILGGVGKAVFQRGNTPAAPLYVADVTGGLGGAAGGGLLGMLGGKGTILSRLLRVGGGLALGVGGSQLLGAGIGMGGPAGAFVGAGGGLGMIAGGAAIAGPLGAIAGSVLAVGQTQQTVSANSTAQTASIKDTMTQWLAKNPTKGELANGLAGVEQGIKDLQSQPLGVAVQGDSLQTLLDMRATLKAQLVGSDALNRNFDRFDRLPDEIASAVERGIVHSGVFRKAQAVREAGGFKTSREALIADLHSPKPLGTDALVTAEAIALAQGNRVRNDPSAANLRSAAYNLTLLRRAQDEMPADLAAKLEPKIHSLEAAINRANRDISNAITAKQFVLNAQIATGHGPTETDSGPSGPKVPVVPGARPRPSGKGPTVYGAEGLFGYTRGATVVAGEVQGEHVTVMKNPRPLTRSASGGSAFSRADVAAIIAAIRQGMAGAKVSVASRTVTRASSIDNRYSNRPLAGVTVD